MMLKSLRKIVNDQAVGIMVVPVWVGQPWYPLFKKLLVPELLILSPHEYLLLSGAGTTHPLHKNLQLAAGILSGKPF